MPRSGCHCRRLAEPWYLSEIVAPFHYRYPMDRHIRALKFLGARRMGRALGLALVAELPDHHPVRVDAMVAVPLHRGRFMERGYNQALEIARALSSELGLPVLCRHIRRSRSTAPQTSLAFDERAANLTRAFRVGRSIPGLRIAIVDDVITTGATVNELAFALRRAGAGDVHAWAVARAG